jgi:hypothetical protein
MRRRCCRGLLVTGEEAVIVIRPRKLTTRADRGPAGIRSWSHLPGQAGRRAASSTCGRSDGGCAGSRSSAITSRPASASIPASFSGR